MDGRKDVKRIQVALIGTQIDANGVTTECILGSAMAELGGLFGAMSFVDGSGWMPVLTLSAAKKGCKTVDLLILPMPLVNIVPLYKEP